MNTTLQEQYPLSPRKFWKKMVEKTAILILIAIPVAFSFFSALLSNEIVQNGIIAFVVIFFILFLGIILYGWYVRVYIRRYFYDATDSYITIKKGVFAPAEIHVQYAKIQDVYVDQDILDRVMGLYDVHLASATAASGIEAHIDGVELPAADGLKNFLLQKLQTGGSGTPPSQNSVPSIPSNMPSEPIVFPSEISTRTYPITDAWFAQQAIICILSFIPLLFISFLQFYFNPGMFWLTSLAIFVVIYIILLIYTSLWRSAYSFSFLPDYIVTKKGVIAKNENHLPYRAVQDVTVSQGIIERMLGIATVRIENAAAAQVVGRRVVSSAVLIPGQPLLKANEIRDAIKRIALTKNSSQTGL